MIYVTVTEHAIFLASDDMDRSGMTEMIKTMN